MKVLGIIPARGGSKGIKNKNIRYLNGKPLIAYAIDTAEKSLLLTDFVVSSDSDEILEVATKYCNSVHKRNSKNAEDHSPINDVIFEIIQDLPVDYDLIILLQPTAPIRSGKDVDNVIKMFEADHDLQNVVSVIELEDIHPARMYQIDGEFNINPLDACDELKRRQDLKPVFLRNGCIYAIRTKAFMKHKTLMLQEKKAYIMPFENWANIDSERDLIITEILIKLWKENKLNSE